MAPGKLLYFRKIIVNERINVFSMRLHRDFDSDEEAPEACWHLGLDGMTSRRERGSVSSSAGKQNEPRQENLNASEKSRLLWGPFERNRDSQ